MALLFLLTETKRMLTLGLTYLMVVQCFATDWGALFAGLVIVMIPTMVAYALLQPQMTAGISMGGLKG
ncbi:hypothetical protein DQX05_24785 [Paenibacillus thiaminolyticus]|uniref:Uncharacterized protein n=2 Tax=Paenibacillus thiaminolyticus TaxID=49283 RepID=A0A3A3GBE3_PANTH|nr:hypothetical protein DQX05_24785 [Paenibacillus thiaminolyticus]